MKIKLLAFIFFCFQLSFLYPSSINMWYWHSYDSLSRKDYENLKRIGIKEIYLKAGHFWYYKGEYGISSFRPSSNDYLKKFPIHLTYTFSQSGPDNFYRQLKKKSFQSINFIIKAIRWQLFLFKALGYKVKGIQFDLEGKIDFSLYGKLILQTRKSFPDLKYSIAVQPYWRKRSGFKNLLKQVDFYVLMLYDLSKAKKLKYYSRITDPAWMEKEIRIFNFYKKDFWAGLPTYSYSLLYDDKGRLISSWAPFRLSSLSENKYFELIKIYHTLIGEPKGIEEKGGLERKKVATYSGESVYDFRVKENITYARIKLKKGYLVRIIKISSHSLGIYLKTIARLRLSYLKGVAFFRYGASWEKHILNSFQLLKIKEKIKNPLKLSVLALRDKVILKLKSSLSMESSCDKNTCGLILFLDRNLKELNRLSKKVYLKGMFDRIRVNREDGKIVFYEKNLSPGETLYTGILPASIFPAKVSIWFKGGGDFNTYWSKKVVIFPKNMERELEFR